GVRTVTPAHYFNDNAVGQRHGLPLVNIFSADARVNDEAPEKYRGMDRFDARKAVLADLDAERLLVETKPHRLQVPRGDRSGQVIEPYLADQCFVDIDEMGRRRLEPVADGSVKSVPPKCIHTYRHWLGNIQDWTISRKLWWGHRIPAWYDEAGNVYVGRDEAEARARAGLGDDVPLRQDSDVLETWFSSALWPFSTLGWPDEAAMRERGFDDFLPTSVLVTGFDIIFFWVARMVMMTDALTGKVAFDDVYITGLVRDREGQKMSKSKGNVLDPLDISDGISDDALVAKRNTGLTKRVEAPTIEKATSKESPDGNAARGAHPLRFTMAALAGPGRDIKFDLGRADGYRNFCNKLWNATRFVLMNTQGVESKAAGRDAALAPVTDAERWILSRLASATAQAHEHFASYRFDLLAQTLYEFAWNEYCDWFVELAKPALQGSDAAAAESTRHTLLVVLEALLRLLHPLIPFVTEELWRHVAPRLGIEGDTISLQAYPLVADFQGDFARAEADVEWLRQMVTGLRRIRSELGVSPSRQVPRLV